MRLLHLTSLYAPHSFGGAERVVQTLAESQATIGLHVGVAHLVPSPVPASELNGVDVLPLRHRNPLWINESAKYPGAIRKFNKIVSIHNVLTVADFASLLDQFKPDVVHTHSMAELSPWMWNAAKRRGIPIVHTLHDFDLLCIRTTLFKDGERCGQRHLACRMLSAAKRSSHRGISQVVGVSQSILDVHLEMGLFAHLPDTAKHVIWNPAKGLQPARHRPNDEVLTFGFLGRLVPEKGIHVLLEACRRLGHGQWQLKIGGVCPHGDELLREQASGLPVIFEGYVDPGRFLGDIDVLVAPATWIEPFGLTVIEALSAGVPVLGSDLGGVGEIIRRFDPSWLVPPNDAGALASRMAELVRSRGDRSFQMSKANDILALTDPELVRESYQRVYEQC